MFAQQPAPFKEPDRDVQSLLNLGHVRAKIEFLADVILCKQKMEHARASHMIALTHTDPSSWHKKKKELKQFGSATKKTTQTTTCSSGRSRTSSPVTAGQPK
ncbi:hypothetical protein L3X38_013472 [Prunus dulcis]|uniref:Uncharacterized protein n=1 Tax=Prunus dulcis TaxID=3755 RepID=A0AAD4ZH12_PRUDU|nr:hypothetical protein L3X38_013472 [Prunus dulcis]